MPLFVVRWLSLFRIRVRGAYSIPGGAGKAPPGRGFESSRKPCVAHPVSLGRASASVSMAKRVRKGGRGALGQSA
jgi:hypothetical protein